jgi:hypothetical protein
MKKLFYSLSRNIKNSLRRIRRANDWREARCWSSSRSPVIVLTAIVGLTVDVGLVYLNHGKLRRAVDAAALAATAQFREGYDTDDLQKAALEFLVLNGINDPSATVETCKTNPGDEVLCTTPERKACARACDFGRQADLYVGAWHSRNLGFGHGGIRGGFDGCGLGDRCF